MSEQPYSNAASAGGAISCRDNIHDITPPPTTIAGRARSESIALCASRGEFCRKEEEQDCGHEYETRRVPRPSAIRTAPISNVGTTPAHEREGIDGRSGRERRVGAEHGPSSYSSPRRRIRRRGSAERASATLPRNRSGSEAQQPRPQHLNTSWPWAGCIRRRSTACRCAPGGSRCAPRRSWRRAMPACASSSSGRRGSESPRGRGCRGFRCG